VNRFLVSNRQTTRKINLPRFRKITACLLDSLPVQKQLRVAVHLINQSEMARLNLQFLQHSGSTDVITFDYGENPGDETREGEIFISIDDAILQGRQFRRPWHEEMIRYLAHGLLHLLEFDDATAAARRAMRRQENRLLQIVAEKFTTAQIEKAA
jgi:probable rRNA maturation factor